MLNILLNLLELHMKQTVLLMLMELVLVSLLAYLLLLEKLFMKNIIKYIKVGGRKNNSLLKNLGTR